MKKFLILSVFVWSVGVCSVFSAETMLKDPKLSNEEIEIIKQLDFLENIEFLMTEDFGLVMEPSLIDSAQN